MNNSPFLSVSASELWPKICQELRQVVSPDAVQRWFTPLQVESFDNDVLVLKADNSIYQYWIEENYLAQLRSVAHRLAERPVEIVFSVAHPGAVPSVPAAPALPKASTKTTALPLHHLSPRNSFDSFVVGLNNQFAHAAAKAVAQAPARTYNPLFLHGNVGLGKTHLMQAIGNYLIQKKANLKIQYVTSEQFTNEFIDAIQHGELVKFRKRYRQVDVLLIDDIQFLAGKDRSQEEFFHTFNALFDGSKQIVLTSDAPPSEIANLEKRLLSRFEWGLIAELQPPDGETRLAILRHKMAAMQEKLPDEVLNYIATNIRSNVRRLEGALTRAAAYATLHQKTPTLEQTEKLLKDILQKESAEIVSIDLIQRRVAEVFDTRLADMTSKRRPAHIAVPRMVAMFISRKLTGHSLSEIGAAFGGRDHGTVLHAAKTIEQKMQDNERLRQTINYLVEKLSSKGL